MAKVKKIIKKIIPQPIISLYHFKLAILANLIYQFPSKKIIVIGVTGTNGKTSTCNLIWEILTNAGIKTGLATSINFKIGGKEWTNTTKQGMQGRFKLQKLLRKMVKAKCKYAIIETTSEGIKQYRHWGIKYDVAVFTNLTPEHIESHGSFKKYKQAKGRLFKALGRNKGETVSIINMDDKHAEYFLGFNATTKWGYGIHFKLTTNLQSLKPTKYNLTPRGAIFDLKINNQEYNFKTNLLGEFNIYNCLSAIAVGLSQNIKIDIIKNALAKVQSIPGRMEMIYDKKRNITVVVDYAHDPVALENVYKTMVAGIKNKQRIIAVLGAVGGGRDTAKRKPLGTLAAKYCDCVIVTNEDPYTDDPIKIIRQVEEGVKKQGSKTLNKNYWVIESRRKAIKKAINIATSGDIIALTGKGAEETMAVKKGFVPWDDRKVVKQLLG